MSHVTPSEFAALEVIAQERARIVAVLSPRAPRTLSITERLQGPATVRAGRPSLFLSVSRFTCGLVCALLAGFYLPAPVAHLVALAIA
jgi:hypothetical protein